MRKSYQTPPLSQMLYGWSKWGGGNYGICREVTEEWSCQICGARQIVGLPQYYFPVDDHRRDFLRVCPSCWHDLREAGVHTLEELNLDEFKKHIKLKTMEVEIKLKTYVEDYI